MDIARLNERITIQKTVFFIDDIGNHKLAWDSYYECYATISDSTGKTSTESEEAGTVVDSSDVSFTVRYCKKAMDVDTVNYRILWRNEIYNIRKIDHLNMRKRVLKFKCEKVRR